MNKHLIYIFIAGALFVSACSSSKPTATAQGKKVLNLSDDTRLKLDRLFIEANKAKLLGEYQKASSLFSECIKIYPTMHASMYELAKIYLETGQTQPGLLFAKQAVELDPVNKWYKVMYAEALAVSGNFKESAKIYAKLVEAHPNAHEFYLDWAYMLIKSNNYNEAIKVYDLLEEQTGLNERIVMQRQLIYLKENKIQKAADELRRLIDMHPGEISYYEMLGVLYQSNGFSEQAKEVFNEMLEMDPEHPRTYIAVSEFYRLEKDQKNRYKYMKLAYGNPKLEIRIKIQNLLVHFTYFVKGREDLEGQREALELSQILIQTHPNEAKAFAIYGDFLLQVDSNEMAKKNYLKALEYDNSIFEIWSHLLDIEYRMESFDSMLYHSEQMLELFPNQIWTYMYNGIANTQLKDYNSAIGSFQRALIISSDDEKLMAQVYSNLGDAYHELDQNSKSDSCYEESIRLNPLDEYTLNNFSYYLSLRKTNLSKAKTMAKKANELHPDNAAFEDTYGWVLFQMKDYKGAKEQLKKSLSHKGDQRPVILEHYGDILFELGETKNALKYWKLAKEKGSDSKDLDKKISDATNSL